MLKFTINCHQLIQFLLMLRNPTKNLNYLLKAKDKNILVTPYHWPDIDGIASSYAMAQFLNSRGNVAKAMKWNEPQMQAQWALNRLNVKVPDIVYNGQDIVLVDVSDPKDIPQFLPLNKIKTVIDHRLYYDLSVFENLNKQEDVLIEPVGSAASLICQICHNENFVPSLNAVNLLYLAIMSNTIKCKSHNTTNKDESAIQWLQDKISVNIDTVNEMFSEKSKITNIKKAIDDDLSSKLQVINSRNVAVALLQIINAEQLLNKNKQQILQSLQQLRQERKADDIFMIVLDIQKCFTYFVFLDSTDSYLHKMIHQLIPINSQSFYFVSKDLWLRKQVIKMLQN